MERVAGGAANKTYYYKVSVAYWRTEKNENGGFVGDAKLYESELSAPVSNVDACYYGSAGPFFLNDDPAYIGAYVTDDDGKRLDTLTLKEGKPQSLRVTCVRADGTEERITGICNSNWYLCKRYYTGQEIKNQYGDEFDQLGEDKVTILPEMGEEGMSDSHVYIKALAGSASSDTYYLIFKMEYGAKLGSFVWQIPIHIEEGNGSDEPIENGTLYTTREALCQAIRDTMVAREDTVLYATGGYEWWNTSNNPSYLELDFEDIFDFHRERAGMKPNEGDYLLLAMGDANSVVSFQEWLTMEDSEFVFDSQYLKKYTVTPGFITTKAQEEQVDQKIDRIIRQEGGALYNYQNASDYEKVRAAYNYVRSNVSYIGTTTPIYHTCYSALINGKATCQGYALLFYRLVRELGVPCRVLMGTDANAHTYNIVRMGDAWYYVDTNTGVLLKGTNDFKPATLQSQYRTAGFQQEYLSKIPKESYAGTVESVSGLTAVESLGGEDIQAIDSNLTAAAADRMTAAYTINGVTVKTSGTVKYLDGCSKYLGYEDNSNMPTSGYFLALKLSVDKAKFTEDGTITVSYTDQAGARKETAYGAKDLTDGAVKLLVNISRDPGIKISVDYDAAGEQSKYDAMLYDLDLSGIKKESQTESNGKTEDVKKYGIELSSPLVKKSGDGKTIDVTYEAVAYSDRVQWTEKAEAQKGNYIALRMEMPASVKATKLAESLTVTTDDGVTKAAQTLEQGWNEAAGCYWEQAADKSEFFLAMPVEKNFNKSFAVRWGGANPLALVQTLTVSVPSESALESRSESALLPGSIAFNGLASTMYVGQSQNIHITFKKKYEQDEIQVFYTTDAAHVVTVNRITGVLKALKPGTANITVSAVDKAGEIVTKTAKVTVKELPAPTGIKTSFVRDCNVTVGWKANTTGQYTEAYAIPYRLTTLGRSAKEWKNVVENALKETGMDETALASLDNDQKAEKLKALGDCLGTGSWSAAAVPAKENGVTLEGLQPETEYVLYFRNVSETAASTLVFSGVANGKVTKTTRPVFHTIRLQLRLADGTVISSKAEGEEVPVYEVKDTETPIEFSYHLLDKDGNEMQPSPELKNIKFTSGNGAIVRVDAPKNAPAVLKYGGQVGETVIMMTGKDASGTLRPSEQLRIRVVKAPTQLKDKATTLTIGQSVPIKELIGTDLKGTAAGMNLDGVDFAAAVKTITDSGYFAVTYPGTEGSQTQNPQDAVITAAALIGGKSGNKIEVPFAMNNSTAKAKIQIKDMAAASIGKITVRDTSAQIEFKPSPAVTTVQEGSRYYTLHITDKVTGDMVEAAAEGTTGNPYICTFRESVPGKTWICEVSGLSSNKTYEAVIAAHYNADGKTNEKASKAKKLTTKKPLLNAGGSIDINYVSLDALRANPNAAGEMVDYDAEAGITLENNGTYVFMAQISKLARTLETDKLKWAVSSGDKKAASIKASSSSYEMQLTTTRTGTFTVTATSTVTKEPVATFAVTVIPYQSGGTGAPEQPGPAPDQTALLPEAYTGTLFKSKREEVA
ncbi:MAG: transglutaminase-like domain-containing protein [Lachnospiraceae bacterium]|nr:transglutaminase-like domain-containing protein [Lachnospiraceae bacterium]